MDIFSSSFIKLTRKSFLEILRTLGSNRLHEQLIFATLGRIRLRTYELRVLRLEKLKIVQGLLIYSFVSHS